MAEIARTSDSVNAQYLRNRLYGLYEKALAANAEVSLGRGEELYRVVEKKIQLEMVSSDEGRRQSLVTILCSIYRTAHKQHIRSVVEDIHCFAFDRFPTLLKWRNSNSFQVVNEVALALHDCAGPRDGLRFLIERIEAMPPALQFSGQYPWIWYGESLARWRSELNELGDLERPLLKVVLTALRDDLHCRQDYNHSGFHKALACFWSEKRTDFLRVAEEVWQEDKHSGAACFRIADYLYSGLHEHGRAIEMLLDAYRRGLLDEAGQTKLLEFLENGQRYTEAIDILQALVRLLPDKIEHRLRLMGDYSHASKPRELAELLKQTDDYFHGQQRWDEATMAALGHCCLRNQLYQQAVDYLAEAIAAHRQTDARQAEDEELSGYYVDQAEAYSAMKKTAEAVDVASAAIVVAPRDSKSLERAESSLDAVLRSASDLNAFVARLDRQAAETRQDNPILRKAIGNAYLANGDYARAIRQLRIAAEFQPNDETTHDDLLRCYDELQDEKGTIEELFRRREAAPRDFKLYQALGEHLQKLGEKEEAERAFTSIVEAQSAEAESHQLLAETRQQQNRWSEAIDQWREVAVLRARACGPDQPDRSPHSRAALERGIRGRQAAPQYQLARAAFGLARRTASADSRHRAANQGKS